MSSSSSLWWEEVLRVADTLYQVWLGSEPNGETSLVPVSPPAFQAPPWLRIEQRGSVALLKALPESLHSELVAQREVSSIGIMFKVLRVYQPGGLGERTTLLKQLVDQKVPSHLSEWLVALRSWRRWLTRVQELGIEPPDPVLLLSTARMQRTPRTRRVGSLTPRWRRVRTRLPRMRSQCVATSCPSLAARRVRNVLSLT